MPVCIPVWFAGGTSQQVTLRLPEEPGAFIDARVYDGRALQPGHRCRRRGGTGTSAVTPITTTILGLSTVVPVGAANGSSTPSWLWVPDVDIGGGPGG